MSRVLNALFCLILCVVLTGCATFGAGTGEFYVGFRTDNVLVAGQKASDDKGFQSSLRVDPSQLVLPKADAEVPPADGEVNPQ